MTTTSSRRAILAGATMMLPVTNLNAAPPLDPIFALIEAHKLTFLHWQRVGKVKSETVDAKWAPDYDEAVCKAVDAAYTDAGEACFAAAVALTEIRPTTMAGVLALIDYIDAFNRGKFGPDDVDGWRSGPISWPDADEFDFKAEGIDDDADEIGMAFAVLLNVRAALAAMQAPSGAA